MTRPERASSKKEKVNAVSKASLAMFNPAYAMGIDSGPCWDDQHSDTEEEAAMMHHNSKSTTALGRDQFWGTNHIDEDDGRVAIDETWRMSPTPELEAFSTDDVFAARREHSVSSLLRAGGHQRDVHPSVFEDDREGEHLSTTIPSPHVTFQDIDSTSRFATVKARKQPGRSGANASNNSLSRFFTWKRANSGSHPKKHLHKQGVSSPLMDARDEPMSAPPHIETFDMSPTGPQAGAYILKGASACSLPSTPVDPPEQVTPSLLKSNQRKSHFLGRKHSMPSLRELRSKNNAPLQDHMTGSTSSPISSSSPLSPFYWRNGEGEDIMPPTPKLSSPSPRSADLPLFSQDSTCPSNKPVRPVSRISSIGKGAVRKSTFIPLMDEKDVTSSNSRSPKSPKAPSGKSRKRFDPINSPKMPSLPMGTTLAQAVADGYFSKSADQASGSTDTGKVSTDNCERKSKAPPVSHGTIAIRRRSRSVGANDFPAVSLPSLPSQDSFNLSDTLASYCANPQSPDAGSGQHAHLASSPATSTLHSAAFSDMGQGQGLAIDASASSVEQEDDVYGGLDGTSTVSNASEASQAQAHVEGIQTPKLTIEESFGKGGGEKEDKEDKEEEEKEEEEDDGKGGKRKKRTTIIAPRSESGPITSSSSNVATQVPSTTSMARRVNLHHGRAKAVAMSSPKLVSRSPRLTESDSSSPLHQSSARHSPPGFEASTSQLCEKRQQAVLVNVMPPTPDLGSSEQGQFDGETPSPSIQRAVEEHEYMHVEGDDEVGTDEEGGDRRPSTEEEEVTEVQEPVLLPYDRTSDILERSHGEGKGERNKKTSADSFELASRRREASTYSQFSDISSGSSSNASSSDISGSALGLDLGEEDDGPFGFARSLSSSSLASDTSSADGSEESMETGNAQILVASSTSATFERPRLVGGTPSPSSSDGSLSVTSLPSNNYANSVQHIPSSSLSSASSASTETSSSSNNSCDLSMSSGGKRASRVDFSTLSSGQSLASLMTTSTSILDFGSEESRTRDIGQEPGDGKVKRRSADLRAPAEIKGFGVGGVADTNEEDDCDTPRLSGGCNASTANIPGFQPTRPLQVRKNGQQVVRSSPSSLSPPTERTIPRAQSASSPHLELDLSLPLDLHELGLGLNLPMLDQYSGLDSHSQGKSKRSSAVPGKPPKSLARRSSKSVRRTSSSTSVSSDSSSSSSGSSVGAMEPKTPPRPLISPLTKSGTQTVEGSYGLGLGLAFDLEGHKESKADTRQPQSAMGFAL